MDQYKKLTVNTLLLSVGTLGSKLISFFMIRLYTDVMQTSEFGITDLLQQTANIMIPICTLGITAGIIRFGLDKTGQYQKNDVFTTGLLCLVIGFIACLIVSPVLLMMDSIREYIFYVYLYILISAFHSVCASFVRAEEKVVIYAINGIFNTLCCMTLMVIFLRILSYGVRGYLMAIIIADLLSSLFLIFVCKIWKRIDFKNLHTPTARRMIRYSVPIIVSTIGWYILTVSDRFMIQYFLDSSANGLYGAAAKIPSLLTILTSVFIDAWQISIIGTKTKLEQSRFFSAIIRSYQAILFVMASGIIMFSKLIIQIMTDAKFHECWQYVPLLVCGTVFSCLASFIGTVYTVERKSMSMLTTTLIGAGLNIILNLTLIPTFGVNGAALSTFVSFFALFLIRMLHSQQFIPVKWGPIRFFFSLAVLLVQCAVMTLEIGPIIPLQIICLLLLLALNFKPLIAGVMKILVRRKS